MRSITVAIWLAAACSGSSPTPNDASDDAPTEVPFTTGTSTLAGGAEAEYLDGARAVARFANPVNVAYRNGVVYVADFDNGKIRAIDATTHVTTTVLAAPKFQRPFALAFAPDGTLYATTDKDPNGNLSLMSGTVWRIDVAAGTATVVASSIGRPRGLGVCSTGWLVVSDYAHHVIETIDPTTGMIATIAGGWDLAGNVDATGGTARFAAPYGLVVRADDSIVVADYTNHRLRAISASGIVTTLAGTSTAGYADGPSTSAAFRHPQGLALAANGDLYITDSDNFRIRKLANGAVTTLAGTGAAGYRDDDDPLSSLLYGIEGIAVVPDGSMVYVADGGRGEPVPYNRVRQIARK